MSLGKLDKKNTHDQRRWETNKIPGCSHTSKSNLIIYEDFWQLLVRKMWTMTIVGLWIQVVLVFWLSNSVSRREGEGKCSLLRCSLGIMTSKLPWIPWELTLVLNVPPVKSHVLHLYLLYKHEDWTQHSWVWISLTQEQPSYPHHFLAVIIRTPKMCPQHHSLLNLHSGARKVSIFNKSFFLKWKK